MKEMKLVLVTIFISVFLSGCFESYDENGFNSQGIHKDTKNYYDKDGYDKNGYDKKLFDKEAKNYITKEEFDLNGFDVNGYNKDGFNKKGIHKETKTKFDVNGYNKDGFNKKGIHKETKTKYDVNGFDKDGYIKNAGKYINVGAIICSDRYALSNLLSNINNNSYWNLWDNYVRRGICMESKYKVRHTKEEPFIDLNDGTTKVGKLFIATQEIRKDKFSSSKIKKDNLNGMVIINNLMWQDNHVNDNNVVDWYKARNYCKNSNYLGYKDWSLPNAFQLKELYENKSKLSFIGNGGYWGHTSELKAEDAWSQDMDDGYFEPRNKDMRSFVRCVRNNK